MSETNDWTKPVGLTPIDKLAVYHEVVLENIQLVEALAEHCKCKSLPVLIGLTKCLACKQLREIVLDEDEE